MKTTEYAGINYAGHTGVNRDSETGIRYGVISQHSVMPEAMDDIWQQSEDLTYKAAVEEAKAKLKTAVADWVLTGRVQDTMERLWAEIEQDFNDLYDDGGERDWLWQREGYKLTNCLQSDIFVLQSPFFTYAQFCSPCVPGACNLDSPLTERVNDNKCYCLGHDFFEGNVAPYPVFSVETGKPVEPIVQP